MARTSRKKSAPVIATSSAAPQSFDNLKNFAAPYRIHIGCGSWKFIDFVNVDTRATEATDVTHDCSDVSIFPDESASMVFSHAFFEHLFFSQRIPLLADIRRVLRPDGLVYFCGLPDFEVIARSYLEKRPGNVSPLFNLAEVYRYTHGIPEYQPEWWVEQLHKTLFDHNEIRTLLAAAGFVNPSIFRYRYRSEPNPITLGFIAAKSNATISPALTQSVYEMFSAIYGNNPIQIL